MLEAELRGKMPEDSTDNEDILTSTAFGLLRYVPPSVFWSEILNRAKSLGGMSFIDRCNQCGLRIDDYVKITLHFWPNHQKYGQPDILLVLHGGTQSPLFFIIEVKLWSQKSEKGPNDQLCRYLYALNDFQWLVSISHLDQPFLLSGVIYLTPRVAWDEIDGSIECAGNPQSAKNDLFNLTWQDVAETAKSLSLSVLEPYRSILTDVARLLEYKGLQHFYGFTELPIPTVLPILTFYLEDSFRGFTHLDLDLTPRSEVHFYEKETRVTCTRR